MKNKVHLLDRAAPGLTERLKRATAHQRHYVFGVICTKASELIQDIEPELAELVKSCREGTTLSASGVEATRRIAGWADERYFDLKERGVDEAVWDNWLKKARLATAISTAFHEDSWESFADGLYELSVIFNDPSDFLRVVEEGIESAGVASIRQPDLEGLQKVMFWSWSSKIGKFFPKKPLTRGG